MIRMVAGLLVLFLGGCATKVQLSPTSRIALFCNPVGHAVDLAVVGVALGVTAYGGLSGLGLLGSGASHQRGTVSVPGVMCYDAIADRVDAAEARHE